MKHGFFGRAGGVSTGIYASLNAGTGSQDDPAAVAENRRRIAAAFNAPATHLVGVHQVHSPDAVFIDAPWSGERPKADALVTTKPGLVISVLTADCTPVLLADADARVIGAAHAGWKGALGGVLESVVRVMRECGATKIAAAIGPTIHQPSYEVGPEFEARFVEKHSQFARYFAPGAGDRRLFDLPAFCADQLRALGLTQIETLPLDTYVLPEALHSHRYSVHQKWADYGRNCAAIAL
ncbi:MAG TPA: peptidoglycan editing factor PgeF [Candidatus Binatia bacterium]|nr:peptidoglycan editing factor PgeF [Candidatus Binatia bacterium]